MLLFVWCFSLKIAAQHQDCYTIITLLSFPDGPMLAREVDTITSDWSNFYCCIAASRLDYNNAKYPE